MVTFPPAKINIGLEVLGKRDDGYHELNTIFYPLPFFDALEVIRDESLAAPYFEQTGLGLDVDPDQNLVYKAYLLLKADFPQITGFRAHLHKAIPSGGGLGGGSSDASSMLKLLNEVFQLELTTEQLCNYALTLGSDCPFFIHNKPSLATGRGEVINAVSLDLSAYKIFLVNPGIHINTGWAFSKLKTFEKPSDLSASVRLPVIEWKNQIRNDFEPAVFSTHPEIAAVKSELYAKGALYVSMSGTGSTVYGIFQKTDSPVFNFPASYFLKWC